MSYILCRMNCIFHILKEKRRSGKSLIFFGFSSFIPSFILILFAVCFQVVDILLRSILLSMFLLIFTTTLLFTTTKWYANNRVIWCKRTKLKQSGRKRTRSRVCNLIVVLWTSVGSRWRESLECAAPRILSSWYIAIYHEIQFWKKQITWCA